MRNTGLFHDSVGGVAGQDFAIHWEIAPGGRAKPNLVIAFAVAHEMAVMFFQNAFYVWRERACHSAAWALS
ncbi:MAG TPA: hypothetical protein VMS78_02375 [Rhizomicrobium sp.]|nr:hypothetical protein [Rhizomicrobium sp.]